MQKLKPGTVGLKTSIIAYSKEASEGSDKKVTFYQISVSSPLQNWKVKRRYNDFFELHQALSQDYRVVPKLPQKTFFSVSTDSSIELRRKELDSYLNSLLTIETIRFNIHFQDFLKMYTYSPEMMTEKPQLLCKYETVSSLIFTDIHYEAQRLLNYTLSSKGIENPGEKAVETLNKKEHPGGGVSHKSILNGFKIDPTDPVNIFQDKKVVKTFDLKAHCLQYFPEAAILVAGFSEGVISVYKEEQKFKADDEYLLTNVAKVKAGKDRITKILINSKKGILYAIARTNKVKIIDMASWTVKGTFKIGSSQILTIAIDDSYDLGISTEEGRLNVFDLSPEFPEVGKTLSICSNGKLSLMECDIDAGKIVCATAETGEIYLIDIEFPFSVVG